jgi:hypothetical protein
MKTCDDYPGECCQHCHTDEATVQAGDLATGGLTLIYGDPPHVHARVCCAKAHLARQEAPHGQVETVAMMRRFEDILGKQ